MTTPPSHRDDAFVQLSRLDAVMVDIDVGPTTRTLLLGVVEHRFRPEVGALSRLEGPGKPELRDGHTALRDLDRPTTPKGVRWHVRVPVEAVT